jgi:hypothetical protein
MVANGQAEPNPAGVRLACSLRETEAGGSVEKQRFTAGEIWCTKIRAGRHYFK